MKTWFTLLAALALAGGLGAADRVTGRAFATRSG